MRAAYAVLAICLCVLVALCLRVRHHARARDLARFDHAARSSTDRLVQGMETYISALRGVRGLIETQGELGEQQWLAYVHSLGIERNYPGLVDLGFAGRVPQSAKEAHVARMRREGITGYDIIPAGEREVYFPLLHWSGPINAGEWTPGWDCFSESRRRDAIQAALVKEDSVATGKVTLFLPRGSSDEAGFVIYMPISRGNPRGGNDDESLLPPDGVALASFRAREFGNHVLGSENRHAIDIEVYDGAEMSAENLIYDSEPDVMAGVAEAARYLAKTIRISGLGRVWTLHLSTLPGFELDSKKHLTSLTLGAGLTVSILLFLVVWTQTRARYRAECLSANLRESENSLKHANQSLMDKIAARQQAESALAAEKERLAVTLKSMSEGVIAADSAGVVVLMNQAAEGLTKWAQAEAAGRLLAEVVSLCDAASRRPFENPHECILGADSRFSRATPALLQARDGTERVVGTTGATMRDERGQVVGVVLVLRDLTESRRMELELNRASKLESLGLLAGGIAHDFNNILTGILGNVALARMQIQPGSGADQRLDKAEAACMRARELTSQLLTFARGGAPLKQSKSIAQLVQDAAGLATIGSNVRCEFKLSPDLWPADVDPTQISQAFNNVFINAVQAMPEGGMIEVTAGNAPPADPDVAAPAQFVRVSIKDNGPGIPRDALHRIFDPFFTTKHKSRGLGLATAYSIVRKHGGRIEVESRPGHGATFHIHLPVAKAAPAESLRSLPAGEANGRRVLVMDDESEILNLSQAVLNRLGYEVELAVDGEEALKRYRYAAESGRPFSVVIMDLTIPGGLGGKDAIRLFREFDPQVRAIVSSGYSSDPVMADYLAYGFRGVVAKPYQIADLAKTLNEVADAVV